MAGRLNKLMSQRVILRDRAEVTRFFGGVAMVEPGVVRIPEWRTGPPGDAGPPRDRVGWCRPETVTRIR